MAFTTFIFGDPAQNHPFLATAYQAPPWPRASGTTIAPVPVAAVLAGGIKGTAYSETIGAQGGATPYTFAVTSGALPTGCTLNTATGVISGTPTAAGTFAFTITVTDVHGLTGSQGFSITITVPAVTASNYAYAS